MTTAPLPSLSPSLLNQFRLTVQERQLGLYGIHVYQEGKGELAHFWRSDDKVCLYSGSKTFTALAVGICQDEGRLRLGDHVLDFFPEHRSQASPGSEAITIRDLLRMSAGKNTFLFTADEKRWGSEDWAALFFADPQMKPAGTDFYYANACTYMLSRVVEKVSGQLLRDYLVPRLFTPLEIYNPQWHTCPGGHTIGATELFLTNREYARLGRLFLEDGVRGGARLVSSAYLRAAVSDTIDNSGKGHDATEGSAGYGYQIWRCSHPGAYRADGMYGQFCVVFPDRRAVVTVTAHEERNANDILRAIYRDIVPALD
jgi:CubicO group peptidase (beta-lactamase class C family)